MISDGEIKMCVYKNHTSHVVMAEQTVAKIDLQHNESHANIERICNSCANITQMPAGRSAQRVRVLR